MNNTEKKSIENLSYHKKKTSKIPQNNEVIMRLGDFDSFLRHHLCGQDIEEDLFESLSYYLRNSEHSFELSNLSKDIVLTQIQLTF